MYPVCQLQKLSILNNLKSGCSAEWTQRQGREAFKEGSLTPENARDNRRMKPNSQPGYACDFSI
jgi:hypothetical protein